MLKTRLPALVLLLTSLPVWPAQGAIQRIGTYLGENAGDQFAFSLCNAGDVNGNGFEDLLVGATLEDTGGDAAGKCYLYLGNVLSDTIPDLTFTGTTGERMGSCVAGSGDLNNDGFDDFAIGALGASDKGPFTGRVYVFFGGLVPDNTPDLVLVGPAADARFGESISMRGDINGDGFADLAVGAPRADSTGLVYVFFGRNVMNTIPDLVLRGEYAGDRFGSAIDTGGDLDGDGADDLLIGAPRNSEAGVWAGKAYAFFGGTALDSIPDLTMKGEAPGDGFGSDVEICADFNGDGSNDFFVSAPFNNSQAGLDAGKVYLYLGGPLLDGTSDGAWKGEQGGAQFGFAVSSADMNGDNLSDLIAGSPGFTSAGSQQGKIYVYFGGLPADANVDFSDLGNAAFDSFGSSVAGFGRFHYHPDGTEEFAAGGWNIDSRGQARLYGEPVSPTGIPALDTAAKSSLEAFPNPFTSLLRISANFTEGGSAEISLYDVAGRRVARVFHGSVQPGTFNLLWNGETGAHRLLPGGVYFLRVRHATNALSRKVILLR